MARSGAPRAALSGPIPGRPPWLAITLFSALATALLCWPSWPGCMSYDSLLAYQQARYGVQTALWPPLHTYLFVLSRAIGADTWGLLLAQTFLLLFGATLALAPGARLDAQRLLRRRVHLVPDPLGPADGPLARRADR